LEILSGLQWIILERPGLVIPNLLILQAPEEEVLVAFQEQQHCQHGLIHFAERLTSVDLKKHLCYTEMWFGITVTLK
jgi:hypothetical protein